MKRWIAMLLVVMAVFSLVACGAKKEAAPAPVETTAAPAETTAAPTETTVVTEPTEPALTMETEQVKVDGVFVDTSYEDEDGKPLKMVYVFLTYKPSESNFDIDSKYSKLVIGANEYSSDFYKGTCKFMPSYYYSSFIEEIFVGTECKLALTFQVPEGDLQAGKEVTMPEYEGIGFTTDDFVHCADAEQIGMQVDPEGCAEVAAKREMADDATTDKVRNAINGYYFSFYVSAGTSVLSYELEFFSPNEFEIRNNYLSNTGTYEVRNGYIFLCYEADVPAVEIAYEFENGQIVLYCAEAFSIYE